MGVALDGFRSDRYDISGALVCLLGVAIILYAPRPMTSPADATKAAPEKPARPHPAAAVRAPCERHSTAAQSPNLAPQQAQRSQRKAVADLKQIPWSSRRNP